MTAPPGYVTAPNQRIDADNGVAYAYRRMGTGARRPLLMLQHFRGNLDYWDPVLVDAFARTREVITFDNVGVAGSSGRTPDTVAQMARDAIAFADALKLESVDLLGYSIGSFVAQEMALIRPSLVSRVVLASSAPRGASGMHGWAPEIIGAVGKAEPDLAEVMQVFYTASPESQRAGKESLGRIFRGRTYDRDVTISLQTCRAQYDAVCEWGIPDHGALQRLAPLSQPVFIAAGDSDKMILPRYSYLLGGLIPGARVKLYPDAAHCFLFQHHEEFAADVESFLSA